MGAIEWTMGCAIVPERARRTSKIAVLLSRFCPTCLGLLCWHSKTLRWAHNPCFRWEQRFCKLPCAPAPAQVWLLSWLSSQSSSSPPLSSRVRSQMPFSELCVLPSREGASVLAAMAAGLLDHPPAFLLPRLGTCVTTLFI